jgi:hypothetical protein
MIYEFVLIIDKPIEIKYHRDIVRETGREPCLPEPKHYLAALLQVNKLIYAEAAPILYSRNTLVFSNGLVDARDTPLSNRLRSFIITTPSYLRQCVRHIVILTYLPRRGWVRCSTDPNHHEDLELCEMMHRIVAHLPGVRKLDFDFDGPYGPPEGNRRRIVAVKGSDNDRKLNELVAILKVGKVKGVGLRSSGWLNLWELRESNWSKVISSPS